MVSNIMIDLKKEYMFYDEKQLERKAITMEKFLDEIIISKKFIGFQIWLNNFTASIVNPLKIEKTKEVENPDIKQFVLAMQIFILNSKRLYHSLELTYTDAAESNYNLLRMVFESILFSFYLSTHVDKADDIIKFFNERFLEIDNPSKKRKEYTIEELEIINRRDKYSPKNIRESLYVDQQRESMKKIYAILSTQSHANIETLNGSHYQYSEKRIRDFFWYIKSLSFYNIVAFLDNLPTTQNIIYEIINKEIVEVLNELKNMASDNGMMGNFFPNHPNVAKSRTYFSKN